MPAAIYNHHGQRKYLTSQEIDAFVHTAGSCSTDIKTFCCMMAFTGCRISEALAMTKDSIDFEAKHVVIRCLKKRGKRVYRAVPLPASYLKALKRWFKTLEGTNDRLWPWSRMTGYRRICEVMSDAMVRGSYASPKGLRHGFGVRAIQASVPLTLVQRWLGHADIKTTAIYTSAVGPEEREIASRMWREERVAPPSPPSNCEERPDGWQGLLSRARSMPIVFTSDTPPQTLDPTVSADTPSHSHKCRHAHSGDAEVNPESGNQERWPKRLTACLLIHFWIKCNRYYRCQSFT